MHNKKGKLCTKLTSSFLRKWWVVLAIAVALLVGGLLVVAFFTAAVELVIDDQITLRPGSQTFEMWRKPPVRPLLKVYVYNVTNADEFLNVVAPGEVREKPILDELGPFVYVETWEKVNLTFHDNGTLTYNQQKVYRFDPEQSVGSEDDVVVVPNIPMLSATSQSKHAARFLRLAMASIMDILKVKPFVEVSVGQLLWGYEDPLLKLAKDVVPKEQKLPYEEFGLMYGLQYIVDQYDVKTLPELLGYLRLDRLLSADGPLLDGILSASTNIILGGSKWSTIIQRVPMVKDYNQPERGYLTVHPTKITRMSLMGRPKNGTSRDNMTVFTGATDIRLFAALDKFNGRTHLPHWTTDSCNRMSGGSDGSLFPPRIQPDTVLHVFDKDMCRKLPLVFKKQVEGKGGVKAYRFGPDHRAFADPDHEPENKCYCPSLNSPSANSTSSSSSSTTSMPMMSTKTNFPQCAPHGTFNVSLCQYDSPVLLSFPHFYMGDPRLREAVLGMDEPDADRHEFYIDVQPEMGVAMRARARVQINLAVSQVVDIKQVATFPDIVFPIIWFEEGIDELPDNVIQLLKLATQTPPVAKAALQYALFASGAVLLLLALGCLVRNSHRQETMSLEGTAHYSQDEKKKPKKTIPPAPMSATVLSNGNGTAAKANAGYVADDE
ncbi:lysosome membrane protein 2 isoform X3 [Aphis gossypii]|uniref:lysosome membrane protein 2 isoform X3 n=1 Tax=Aphis gossypii TaxID=80765 RepID=UPI002158B7DB|nr:lysosome membrane protein 2 isoform X3 [Aphis gossypii]